MVLGQLAKIREKERERERETDDILRITIVFLQCPVAFAMYLYIDRENLNKQLDNAAQLKTPDGCTAPGIHEAAILVDIQYVLYYTSYTDTQ